MTMKLLIEDHDGNQKLVTDDLDRDSLKPEGLRELAKLICQSLEQVSPDRVSIPAVA